MNFWMTIYQGSFMPFDTRLKNNLELFNEWAISVSSFNFICFTDIALDPWAQYTTGWSLIAIITITFIINLATIFKIAFNKMKLVIIKYSRVLMNKLKKKQFLKKFFT